MGVIVARAPWQYGRALSFDGVDDFVGLGDPGSLRISDTLTLEAWVYYTGPDNTIRFWFGNGYTDSGSIAIGSHNAIADKWWLMLQGPHEFAWGTKQLNVWTYLAITLDLNLTSSQLKGYQDGVQRQAIDWTNQILTRAAPKYVGKSTVGGSWGGLIDSVRIYDRALSQGEIRNNFLSMKPVNISSLVLWLKMDEVTGDKVWDHSGQGNHGTLYGATRVQGIVPAW